MVMLPNKREIRAIVRMYRTDIRIIKKYHAKRHADGLPVKRNGVIRLRLLELRLKDWVDPCSQ